MNQLGRGLDPRCAAWVMVWALLLSPAWAGAQTTPPPTEPVPSPPPTEPAPPPAPPAPPKVSYPTVLPTREIKLSEHAAIRFGVQAQVWYEALQDAGVESESGDQGYQLNFFCRRCRVLAGAQPWENVTLFVLIEATNLGKGTLTNGTFSKNLGAISILDAYAEVKFSEAFMLEAGNMLVPLSRNVLQGTTTYIGLDINQTSAQHVFATQTSQLRDVGLVLKGYVLDEKLGYRVGVFSGIRDAPVQMTGMPLVSTASENPPRFAGYLQYNLLDVDKGYIYNGIYYGRKRIAGVAAGIDFQDAAGDNTDPYLAFSVAGFAAIPLNGVNKLGADEIHALAQFVHYDGGGKPGMLDGTAPGLRNQNDFAVEAGYYNKASKLSVFGRFEGRFIAEEADKAIVPSQIWFGGGVKYHLIDNAMQFTLAYTRSQFPDDPPGQNAFNQLVLAVQALYF